MASPVLLVHGGAGRRRAPDPDLDAERLRALARAIERGWERLGAGAEAACVAAVRELEDCPLFNAATGSALASDGGVWCDATLMCADGRAGAVAGVQGIRNPILAAQALAGAGGDPLLWAGGSEELAARHGLERADPASMITEHQLGRLARRRARLGERDAPAGTVGAVCLDAEGVLAAATSTGGYCGKPPARVGDSAIPGAGTWAHALTCAVSATGDGEAFIRAAFAHEIHARMLHAGEDLETAAAAALETVGSAGGEGGAICVDAGGAIAMPLTAEAMPRAWRCGDDATRTAI